MRETLAEVVDTNGSVPVVNRTAFVSILNFFRLLNYHTVDGLQRAEISSWRDMS